MQDSKDKDTSTDEVQSTREYKNEKNPSGGSDVCVVCVV